MKNLSIDYVDASGESCIANRSQNEHRERLIARQNETRAAARAEAARNAKRWNGPAMADAMDAMDALERTFGA